MKRYVWWVVFGVVALLVCLDIKSDIRTYKQLMKNYDTLMVNHEGIEKAKTASENNSKKLRELESRLNVAETRPANK